MDHLLAEHDWHTAHELLAGGHGHATAFYYDHRLYAPGGKEPDLVPPRGNGTKKQNRKQNKQLAIRRCTSRTSDKTKLTKSNIETKTKSKNITDAARRPHRAAEATWRGGSWGPPCRFRENP